MGSIVGVLETQVRASTQDFERGMDRAGKSAGRFEKDLGRAAMGASRAFGNAMSAVAASQAAQEKSWTTLTATIVSSFAMGGPVMGAISVAAAAIGLIVSKFKESGRAAEEASAKWQKEMEKRRDALAKLGEELGGLRSKGLFTLLEGRAPTAEEAQLDKLNDAALRARIERDAARSAELRQMMAGGFGDVSMEERRRATARAEEALRLAEEMAGKQRLIVEEQAKQQAALDEIAARQKRRNDQEELYLRYLENEERILARQGADDPRMRWLMSGQAALPPITGPYSGASQGFTPGAPFRPDPGVPHGPWWPGPLQVPQDFGPGPFGEDAGEALERFREEERARLDAISQEIAEPFHQAFARAVVDGFREGFDNLKDIGEALLADWLGMFAQGISRQVFQPIFNNLVGAVAGGGGGSTLQVLPVALPAEVVNAGIGVSSSLQGTIHAIGSEVRTLEEFRRN